MLKLKTYYYKWNVMLALLMHIAICDLRLFSKFIDICTSGRGFAKLKKDITFLQIMRHKVVDAKFSCSRKLT